MSFALVTTLLLLPLLCAIFDHHLDMNSQISHVISACSYHLRNINHISRYLPTTTKERVINALITSRLDYCNSLLYNTSANNISRLQRMHNAAARLILCRPRTDRATPLLRKLHWLPVARRIQYKILLLSYKITNRHAQFYLRDLLPSYQPTRCLRSSSSNALVVPRTRGRAGDVAFAVAAPRLWNTLPHQLTCAPTSTYKKIILRRIFLHVSLTLTMMRSDAFFYMLV